MAFAVDELLDELLLGDESDEEFEEFEEEPPESDEAPDEPEEPASEDELPPFAPTVVEPERESVR
ncbi:hypothetical protein [Pseudonocardia sp.]|uniref:hypothetical protein n=1 Tax=Pseudonocardia sp. TaxID=60912 RepID=UPI003D149D80